MQFFSLSKMKSYELRTQSKEQLVSHLAELKKDLLQTRVQKVSGGNAPKFAKLGELRKQIARTLTISNELQRTHLKLFYKGKKYVPLDLRPKLTRAIRRRMTKEQLQKKTLKQTKKDMHFPMRKYAVKQ